MPLDIDPLFHTETMVQILREQGSTLYAMELAELILEKDPKNQSVAKILLELQGEARAAFDRFKKGGQAAQAARLKIKIDEVEARNLAGVEKVPSLEPIASESPLPAETPEEIVPEDNTEAATEAAQVLSLSSRKPAKGALGSSKVQKLKSLLKKIQRVRGNHDTA